MHRAVGTAAPVEKAKLVEFQLKVSILFKENLGQASALISVNIASVSEQSSNFK